MTEDVSMGDRDERIAFLARKVDREGLRVPIEVIEYLAERGRTAQGLRGMLVQLQGAAQSRGVEIDMALARRVLEGVTEAPEEPAPAAEPAPQLELAPEPAPQLETLRAPEPEPASAPEPHAAADEPAFLSAPQPAQEQSADETTFVAEAPEPGQLFSMVEPLAQPPATLAPAVPVPEPAPPAPKATVWFAPVRTTKKQSLVTRAGQLLERAGLSSAIAESDLVAIKLHFGEEGNTGFISPVFLREVVRKVRDAGGKPFLTDCNTLYRGKRANAVDHLACAVHNGFGYSTVDAPLIIADGLDGREGVEVPIDGFDHFDSVRIGAAAAHADAMIVVTHVKGHEATGFGGAMKNVGMGLGVRSAKQRMHADFTPHPSAEKCTACGRCCQWCPVEAITIGPDRVAVVDHEVCYGCGECVAACPHGAIAIEWKTDADSIQEKIVEHCAGALSGKADKVVYLSFLTNITPDCDCWHFSDAPVVADIGVLASTDLVAIDQAAYDLVSQAAGLAGTRGEGMAAGDDKFASITGINGTRAMSYAEGHGLGTRSYDLKTLG